MQTKSRPRPALAKSKVDFSLLWNEIRNDVAKLMQDPIHASLAQSWEVLHKYVGEKKYIIFFLVMCTNW